jgi:hypothetical protein
MKWDMLFAKLIQVARLEPPDAAVPYAFEKRVMARLLASTAFDFWSHWSTALWRASAPCLLIMLLCAAWAQMAATTTRPLALSNELERAVYAVCDAVTEPQ